MKRDLSLAVFLGLAACSGNVIVPSDGGTGGTSPVTCSDCLAETITWSWNGGLVAAVEGSSLGVCRTYQHTWTPVAGQPGVSQTCTVSDIGGCGAPSPSVRDVEQAIAHPDVVAALSGTTPLYGTDPRPCDGSVVQVSVGAQSILVGGDCGSSPSCLPGASCVPVPPGVRALVELLDAIDKQEQPSARCTHGI
jgi:hypothetical protein